ncbi:MAG: hypothetical protein J2P25_17160 [Nocardiopsaceae bacterium]|nr:hypothetical protein [Nocardiopsaceae bacterium]
MRIRLRIRLRLAAAGIAAVCAVLALTAGTAPAARAATPPLPSHDPFYTYSGQVPLSKIAPGTVLKERAVSLKLEGLTVPVKTEQVLYRTTGELGQPTVTVTTIIKPLVSLGTKIVAYQNAYDALGTECDPSYTLQGGNNGDSTGQEEEVAIAGYVAEGYTVTVPDYEGEAMEWGAGQESGRDTLDAIRATERYLGVPASTRVGMLGYSGGSIATEWAAELAPRYAPGLNIVGTAIGGVPVDYAHVLNYIDGDTDWSGIMPAFLISLPHALNVGITKYLSAYGKQLMSQVAGKCIASFATAYPGLKFSQLFLPRYSNPYQVPVFVSIMNHFIMGTAPGHPREPMLIGVGDSDGTGDGIMIAGDEEALAHEYCTQGVPVTFQEYPGLPHADAAVPWEAAASTFLQSRLAGLPAPNGCAAIGHGNSLAPLPEPSS